MKLVKLDVRRKIIKGIIKSYRDLSILVYLVDKGDEFTAYSKRKITAGKSHEIKTVKIGLEVDNTQLTETSLDISGKIVYSSDENVPLHKYHKIILKKGNGFILKKNKLLDFQIKLVKQSVSSSPRVFICAYENGLAIMYVMSDYGIKKKMEIKQNVSGKRFSNETRKTFFSRLSQILREEYKKGYTAFIVAGKSLDNDELKKEYLNDLNVSYETVSYADTGLKELLSKDSINAALLNAKLLKQINLMKEYILSISKNDQRYVYGTNNILNNLSERPPLQAIVSKDYVLTNKDIIEKLDRSGCEIVLFDEEDDSLKQLIGFGGIIVKFTNN